MSNVNPNLIHFVSIRTLKGTIDAAHDEMNYSSTYQFSFATNSRVEKDTKLIRFVLDVTIKNVDENNEPTGLIASYTNEFIFHIENLDELIDFNEENKEAIIDFDLGVTLANMAYGTMRGIIHTRTQGTILNGIILPVILPQNLLINKQQIELFATH